MKPGRTEVAPPLTLKQHRPPASCCRTSPCLLPSWVAGLLSDPSIRFVTPLTPLPHSLLPFSPPLYFPLLTLLSAFSQPPGSRTPPSGCVPAEPQCNKLYTAVQAASSSAQGLKAPSSLAVGAAIPTTKQAVLSQTDAPCAAPAEAQQPGKDKAGPTPTATAGKPGQTDPAAAANPAVERRPLEGLDEAVANGLRALCQVSAPVTTVKKSGIGYLGLFCLTWREWWLL